MLERTPKLPPKIEPLAANVIRPTWSVMIPSYNCIHYLRKTIESVLQQAPSVEEMQIEVVDDFSIDGDVEALVNEIGRNRVTFFKQQKNVGSLRNFETCINRSTGTFVHILHGDDLVKPGFYRELESLFERFPDIGAAFTGCTDFDENDAEIWDSKKILSEPGIIDNWLFKIAEGQLLQTPCIVVKRSVYEHLGGFFGVHYGEDWEMWTRIAAHYPVAYSPKPLAFYRVHSSNITSNSFRTGQNIKDISTVIDIIQHYLPKEERKRLKRKARKNYAFYVTMIVDGLYRNKEPKAAILQTARALRLYASKHTLYYFIKILVKILIRYKVKTLGLKNSKGSLITG